MFSNSYFSELNNGNNRQVSFEQDVVKGAELFSNGDSEKAFIK